ncbi:MAG: hypothetical protein ACREIU_06705 [Planctomycetota bacterium]
MDEFAPPRRKGRLKIFLFAFLLVVGSGLLANRFFDRLPPRLQSALAFLK